MQTVKPAASQTRQVLAAVIGNALEWYDFIVYAFLASIIAREFFPSEDQYTSLLMTLATFGVGFFMRPVGGVWLGIYADRKGRKAAMQLIIRMMTLSIAIIAFAPNYAAIGMGAPLLIIFARMLQGFATGGEFASATAFLVESAPAHRKGFYGSWQLVGQGLAVFFGAAMVALVTHFFSPAVLDLWGWRLPFVLGLLIGPVGWWIRRNLSDPHEYLEARKNARGPAPSLLQVVRTYRRNTLVSIAMVSGSTVAFYVVLVSMPTFAHINLGLPLDQVLMVQMFAVAAMTLVIPLSGALSDRMGRRPVMLSCCLLLILLVLPLYMWLAEAPSILRLVVMQTLLCVAMAGTFGPTPTALAEQFPTHVRTTGVSLAYNVSVMFFGGFAPLIVTWLSTTLNNPVAPALYVTLACVFTWLGIYFMHEPSRNEPTIETHPS